MNNQSRTGLTLATAIFASACAGVSGAATLEVFDFSAYGDNTGQVVATPDGTQVIAVDSGPFIDSANVARLGFFDSATNTLIGEYTPDVGFPGEIEFLSGSSVAYLAMSKSGGAITTTGSNRIDIIDVSTRSQLDSIPIAGSGFGPSALALSPNEDKLYSLHRGDGRVDVIDIESNTVVDNILVGTSAVDIDFSPDNLRAYVSGRGNPVRIVVIDVTTDSIDSVLTPGVAPTTSSVRSAVAPDHALYIASNTDSSLKVIDIDPASPSFHETVATVDTTAVNIREVTINPVAQELYVSGADSGNVITIDVDPASPGYRTQIDDLTLPESPAGMAWQPAAVADLYITINGDATGYFTVGGPLNDFDLDGVANGSDNCSGESNPSQLDTNADGFGNICDPDINNDCITNIVDLGLLRTAFFGMPGSANWNPDADFSGDGIVNIVDLGILRQRFFLFPGPSGITDICN